MNYTDVDYPEDFGILLKNPSFKNLPLDSKPSEWKPHSGDVIKWIEEVIKFGHNIRDKLIISLSDNLEDWEIILIEPLNSITNSLNGIKHNLIKYEKSKEFREEMERDLKKEYYNNLIYCDFYFLNNDIYKIEDEIKKLDKESELYKNIDKILINSLLIIHISFMIIFSRTFK